MSDGTVFPTTWQRRIADSSQSVSDDIEELGAKALAEMLLPKLQQ